MSVHIYAISHSEIYANNGAEDETPICGCRKSRWTTAPDCSFALAYGLLNTGHLEYATYHACGQKGPALRAGDGEASTPCSASPEV